jgi:hypothetical protein
MLLISQWEDAAKEISTKSKDWRNGRKRKGTEREWQKK